MDLATFLPTEVTPALALALVGLSFVTSLITATFSLGGGTLMVAALALVFPPAVVVPVHGCVQLGSNAGRAVLQRAHVQRRHLLWIGAGAAIGTILGAQLTLALPEQLFGAAIAVFVLVTTWLPLPRSAGEGRAVQFIGGTLISALGMIVGAVGPLVALFLRGLPDRRQIVATHAALMTVQNLLKIAAFAGLGFAFAPYLPLVLAMVLAGFAGTAIGTRLLLKVPEAAFRLGFKIVLTLVALDLLRRGIWG